MNPEKPLRIIAWNVNHRTFKKKIPKGMIRALVKNFDPEIIVLTEYVESTDRHNELCDELTKTKKFCAKNIHTKTQHGKGHNGVLVATSMDSTKADPPPDASFRPTQAGSNYLHIHISTPDLQLELVGFRMESDKCYTDDDRCTYWKWLARNLDRILIDSKSVIAIGDFNLNPELDPEDRKNRNWKELQEFNRLFLKDNPPKWMVPKPSGEWSYCGRNHSLENPSSSRIDHALVSTALTKLTTPVAKYEFESESEDEPKERYVFGGPERLGSEAWSDHAVLVLDVDVRRDGTLEPASQEAGKTTLLAGRAPRPSPAR